MWERAEGVPPTRCQPAKGRVTRRGLGRVRLGASSDALLRRAGQPGKRPGRSWSWCVPKRGTKRSGRVAAVLTRAGRVSTVLSTAGSHRALRVAPGAKAKRARARTRPFGRGVRARRLGGGRRIAVGVRKGRVRWVAVTTARSRGALRRELRLAGVR